MMLTGKLTENNPHVSCRRLLVERCLMNSSTQVKTNILPCMSRIPISIHGFEARLFGRVCFCQLQLQGSQTILKGTGMLVGERTDTMPVMTRRRRFWDAAHLHIPKKITRSFSTDQLDLPLRSTHTYGVQLLMKLACVRPRLYVGGCIQQHNCVLL